MGSGEEDLIRYYYQVLDEVRARSERVEALERQVQALLKEVKVRGRSHGPILRVVDLTRHAGLRSERLSFIKDLYQTLEEAKNDLEMAERRKLDVLEELHENGLAPGMLPRE